MWKSLENRDIRWGIVKANKKVKKIIKEYY